MANNVLNSVSAVAANDVWAVGYSGSVPGQQTLIMRWNGREWNLVPGANPRKNSALNSVASISAKDVWAVGQGYEASSTDAKALIEHWDGTGWTVSAGPTNSNTGSSLRAIAATSVNDIWAVGSYTSSTAPYYHTLTLHWDGAGWQRAASPDRGTQESILYGVSGSRSDNVWAIGYYQDGAANPPQPLIERWNGSTWSVDHASIFGAGGGYLYAVSSLPSGSVWAAGQYGLTRSGAPQTLALHHMEVPCASPTPTGTAVVSATATYTPAASTATRTSTPCAMNFSDVPPDSTFYIYIRYLYCAGVISGYSDGTFRPGNTTTRGQLTKIVVLARGWTIECPSAGHFSDVPVGSVFYCFIETAYGHGIISGYSDGTFRPGNNVTRAQLTKIVVIAMNWTILCPATGHFSDVGVNDPFYCFIETAYGHGIISGYNDGTFRPGNSATRAQISKIVYLAVTQYRS